VHDLFIVYEVHTCSVKQLVSFNVDKLDPHFDRNTHIPRVELLSIFNMWSIYLMTNDYLLMRTWQRCLPVSDTPYSYNTLRVSVDRLSSEIQYYSAALHVHCSSRKKCSIRPILHRGSSLGRYYLHVQRYLSMKHRWPKNTYQLRTVFVVSDRVGS